MYFILDFKSKPQKLLVVKIIIFIKKNILQLYFSFFFYIDLWHLSYLRYLCLFAYCGLQNILTVRVTWWASYKRQELLVLHGCLGCLVFFALIDRCTQDVYIRVHNFLLKKRGFSTKWYCDLHIILIWPPFFRFVNNRESHLFGIFSLAHAPVNVTDFSIYSINCNPHNADRLSGRSIIWVT